MLKLRQFDLQLAFAGARALGENIENERGAVEDFAIENPLEISALGGRKLVVENNRIDFRAAAVQREFIRFPLADERPGTGCGHFLQPIADDFGSGGGSQLGKFLQRIVRFRTVPEFEFYSYQKDPFSPSVPRLD